MLRAGELTLQPRWEEARPKFRINIANPIDSAGFSNTVGLGRVAFSLEVNETLLNAVPRRDLYLRMAGI
jgi:hypothetical protein